MSGFIELLVDFYTKLLAILDYFTFEFNGVEVSLLGIFLCLSLIAFVASAFWRGAKK